MRWDIILTFRPQDVQMICKRLGMKTNLAQRLNTCIMLGFSIKSIIKYIERIIYFSGSKQINGKKKYIFV